MAFLTTSLTRLRADFNAAFPGRDKTTDGWIGNLAHQTSASGHNPDETGRAESRDADLKDEVRAIDVDRDLRGDRTMLQVIRAVLATLRDRDRLRYIIFDGVIWTKSTGWQPHRYTGSNLHDKHAHFSGDPNFDEDDAPFASVLGTGDDMDATQALQLRNAEAMLGAFRDLNDPVLDPGDGKPRAFTNGLAAVLRRLDAAVAADEARDRALQAAFTALATSIGNSGGSIDAAPIVAAVNAAAEQASAAATALQVRIDELEAELAQVRRGVEAGLSPAEQASLNLP